jgi:Dirigent-like protein
MAGKRLVVMAVLAAAATMVTMATSAAAAKPQTISLLEVDNPVVGIGGFPTAFNEPPSAGQGFVVTGILYKWAGTKKGAPVGNARGVCTVTSVNLTNTGGTIWTHCDVALSLPTGLIEVSGPLNLVAQANNVPIVGGNSAYVGAQGYVTHKNIGPESSNNSSDVIHITN